MKTLFPAWDCMFHSPARRLSSNHRKEETAAYQRLARCFQRFSTQCLIINPEDPGSMRMRKSHVEPRVGGSSMIRPIMSTPAFWTSFRLLESNLLYKKAPILKTRI